MPEFFTPARSKFFVAVSTPAIDIEARKCGLALDAACGQAAGQVLLDGHEQDDHRDNGEDGSGKQILPLDDVVAVEDIDTHGQRLGSLGGDQAQCHGVFVPGIDENENQGGDDARRCHRQQHLEHGLHPVAAVDGGGLLHFGGDAQEGAPEQPDGKGLVEGGVHENQTQQGVGQTQHLHDLVNADKQHHRGEHLGDNDETQEYGLPLELHPGQGVGCGNAAEHGNDGGAGGDDDGIEHILGHGCFYPDVGEVRPKRLDRKERAVHGKNLVPAFQSSGEHNEVRVENEQTDEHDCEVQQNPGQQLAPVNPFGVQGHNHSSPFFRVETM